MTLRGDDRTLHPLARTTARRDHFTPQKCKSHVSSLTWMVVLAWLPCTMPLRAHLSTVPLFAISSQHNCAHRLAFLHTGGAIRFLPTKQLCTAHIPT